MLNYIKASISAPGFFPPVVQGNSSLADGSTIASADIPEAIDRCRAIVNNDKDIILDVIMIQEGNTNNKLIVKSLTKDCSNNNALQMMFRYVSYELMW